jgi:CNT family concentrative nucleoside transporter
VDYGANHAAIRIRKLSAAANIFMGQTEAPLLVRPFIKGMTSSELNCLMVGGMATIAGSVLGAYVSFLGGGDPQEQAKFASYLLSASIMNAPAAIVLAKIFMPETEPDKIDRSLKVRKIKLVLTWWMPWPQAQPMV